MKIGVFRNSVRFLCSGRLRVVVDDWLAEEGLKSHTDPGNYYMMLSLEKFISDPLFRRYHALYRIENDSDRWLVYSSMEGGSTFTVGSTREVDDLLARRLDRGAKLTLRVLKIDMGIKHAMIPDSMPKLIAAALAQEMER